jgi:GT2 family glycosyltransferase
MRKLTVIVMTFYERHKQLINTLNSFYQYDPDDFSVVIVDDNSPTDISLSSYTFQITILKLRQKQWKCPAPVFNFGFIEALKQDPESIIIQNAECYHRGNILGYVRDHLTQHNYLSFAAYSLANGQTTDIKNFNNVKALSNGDSAWYNHSVYRPGAFHFCSAITASNLRKINGFEESFAEGLGYEDDYLLNQVRLLGLKVKIVDNPFVLHQYHYDIPGFNFTQELYSRNAALLNELKARNTYRATHYITSDL